MIISCAGLQGSCSQTIESSHGVMCCYENVIITITTSAIIPIIIYVFQFLFISFHFIFFSVPHTRYLNIIILTLFKIVLDQGEVTVKTVQASNLTCTFLIPFSLSRETISMYL